MKGKLAGICAFLVLGSITLLQAKESELFRAADHLEFSVTYFPSGSTESVDSFVNIDGQYSSGNI